MFNTFSLIHNGSSLVNFAAVGTGLVSFDNALKFECVSLLCKTVAEFHFNRLGRYELLHHSCMFTPSALSLFYGYNAFSTVIVRMHVSHIPLMFHFAGKVWPTYTWLFEKLYLVTWPPAILYRQYLMLDTIVSNKDLYSITVPIGIALLFLDLFWVPRNKYKKYLV